MQRDEILKFIKLIRSTFGKYKDYSGGCYKFHLILISVFDEGIGYYNSNHVITKVGESYYDITGRINPPRKGEYLEIGRDKPFTYEGMNKIFEEYL